MAKLSDIFGRKGTAGPDKLTGRSRNGNGNGSDHISIESPSDVGSRIGEENEVLRNLLTDTGRKINELEDLKDGFRQAGRAFQQHPARARAGKIAEHEPVRNADGSSHVLRNVAHRVLSGRKKIDGPRG